MKKKGFTLVELLIVIAIIGILASIVLVYLGGGQNKAKVASFKASFSSVSSAVRICKDAGGAVAETNNGGGLICSKLSDEGGTNAVWPAISVCGATGEDTVYGFTDNGEDDWTYEVSSCAGFSECVGSANAVCGATGGCVFSGTCQ